MEHLDLKTLQLDARKYKLPVAYRKNLLYNANYFKTAVLGVLVCIGWLVEYHAYLYTVRDVLLYGESASTIALIILLFSKGVYLCLYRPCKKWIKDKSTLFTSVLIVTGISLIVNIILFAILFAYNLRLQDFYSLESKTADDIVQLRQLANSSTDPQTINLLNDEISSLEEKKTQYSLEVNTIQYSPSLFTIKKMATVLLSINAVLLSSLLYLFFTLYLLSLFYAKAIKRLKKRLDSILGTYHSRRDSLRIKEAKENEIRALFYMYLQQNPKLKAQA